VKSSTLGSPSKLGTKFGQRLDDELQVLASGRHHHIDILSDVLDSTMEQTGHPADSHVGNAVPVEHLNYASEIKWKRTQFAEVGHDTALVLAPGERVRSTQGSSAVGGGNVGKINAARRPAPGGCTRPCRAMTYTHTTSSKVNASVSNAVIRPTAARNSDSPTAAMIRCALARSDSSISISISPTLPPTDKYRGKGDGLFEVAQRVPQRVGVTCEVRKLDHSACCRSARLRSPRPARLVRASVLSATTDDLGSN
jgi:hypothetical protein